VKESYHWEGTTSIEVATRAASALYDAIVPEKSDGLVPPHDFHAQMEDLVECKLEWANILTFIDLSQESAQASDVKRREVKRKLTWLEGQILRQETPASAQGGDPALQPSEGKRPLDEPLMPPSKKPRVLPPTQPPAGITAEAIMARLRFDPRQSPCLNYMDKPMHAMVDAKGLLATPAVPNAKDMVELVDGSELTDLIIQPYMAYYVIVAMVILIPVRWNMSVGVRHDGIPGRHSSSVALSMGMN